MSEIHCEYCGGNGTLTYTGGPGYFSTSFGNYLPTEYDHDCPKCDGRGLIERLPEQHTSEQA